MARAMLPFLLLAACKAPTLPNTDGGVGTCPPFLPNGVCDSGQKDQSCSRDGANGPERCTCDGSLWRCVDARCPTVDHPTGPCPNERFQCNYGFEHSCQCTRNGWKCCGGVTDQCPFTRPVEGSLCGCQVGVRWPYGPQGCDIGGCPDRVHCECIDNGWRCTPLSCADGGAADM